MFSLNVCVTCQTFLLQDQPLCEFCFSRFSNRVTDHGPIVRKKPVFTQSLWSWDRHSEELSRALVYSLKGVAESARWLRFATLFLHLALPLSQNSCLVPIPSKTGQPDHAFGLACALSELTGLPIENGLRFEASAQADQAHQRELNRQQRRHIRMVKAGRLRKSYANFILVDDVVTSGATLHAAFRALNEPFSAQAICFMDRRLVADFDEPCYNDRQ